MKKNVFEKIKQNYPEIYPFDFVFECDTGWFDLISELSDKIQKHCKESGCKQVIAIQVKEKFGTLRYYFTGGDDKVNQLVDEYEERSISTCEITGGYGDLTINRGYYKTLCKETALLLGFKNLEKKEKYGNV
jgi:hypothetical protein